jgi:hypothetical protein
MHAAAEDPVQGLGVDRVVDRLAHLDVVERRLLGVHPEEVGVDRILEAEAVAVAGLDLLQTVGCRRVHHEVDLVLLDVGDPARCCSYSP